LRCYHACYRLNPLSVFAALSPLLRYHAVGPDSKPQNGMWLTGASPVAVDVLVSNVHGAVADDSKRARVRVQPPCSAALRLPWAVV